MMCIGCGGEVIWMGPMSNLTHTECKQCGSRNNQIIDPELDDQGDEWDEEDDACGRQRQHDPVPGPRPKRGPE